jgi:hypothetical protein
MSVCLSMHIPPVLHVPGPQMSFANCNDRVFLLEPFSILRNSPDSSRVDEGGGERDPTLDR